MNITEKATQLYELYNNHWDYLNCRQKSNLLVALRDLQLEIDPSDPTHYEAQLLLDQVAAGIGVFIGPNGEIDVVGPAWG